MSIRVRVASRDPAVRARLVRTLSIENDIEVVAGCPDGAGTTAAERARADVALVDLDPPCPSCQPARPDGAAPPGPPLTVRELDTVRLVAGGLSNGEIAEELFVSLSTVKSHVSSAAAKLGARNRVEVAAWAWASGTVAPPALGRCSPPSRA